jgi:hypothetical protein
MCQRRSNQTYTCPDGPRANFLYHGNSFQSNVRTSHRHNTSKMSRLIGNLRTGLQPLDKQHWANIAVE